MVEPAFEPLLKMTRAAILASLFLIRKEDSRVTAHPGIKAVASAAA